MTAVAVPARSDPWPRVLLVSLALLGAAIAFGLAAGSLVAADSGIAVVGFAVVLVPVLLWKRPYLAPAVTLFAALTVEQFPNNLGTSAETVTSGLPLFHGLGSLHLSAADVLLGGVTLLVLTKGREQAVERRAPSALTFALCALLAAVLVGVVSGLSHHGEVRVSLMETRPYIYLAATYFIASKLLVSRAAIRAVLWAIVIAGGIKAAQAMLIFVAVRSMSPRPEAVLGHEEALFFGVFLFLTASLWLFGIRGRLRTAATWIAPLVIMADLANSRRAAWLVLGGGLITLAAVAMRQLPSRRQLVIRVGSVVCVVLALYMPAFWNKTGGLAQPARAVRSIVAPSARDASSDLYRIQEDENLHINIQEGGLLGRGFGVPIDYVLPIADISDIDPLIDFVPHNGVLYILMRMGLLGGVALFALIGVGLISACRLARSRDRELAVVGTVLVCALIGYAMEGAVDQGFFFYRIAFVMGSLLGLMDAAHRLQRAGTA